MKLLRKILLAELALFLAIVMLILCFGIVPDLIYEKKFSRYSSSYKSNGDIVDIKAASNNSLGNNIDATTYLTNDFFFYKSCKPISVFGVLEDYNFLMCYDLHTAKVKPIELDFTYSTPDNLLLLGDMLYFTVENCEESSDDRGFMYLLEYNIKTGNIKTIYKSADTWSIISPFISDNTLYFIANVYTKYDTSYECLLKYDGIKVKTVKNFYDDKHSLTLNYIESDGESSTLYLNGYSKKEYTCTINKNGVSDFDELAETKTVNYNLQYRKFGNWEVRESKLKSGYVFLTDVKEEIIQFNISNGNNTYNLAKAGVYNTILFIG